MVATTTTTVHALQKLRATSTWKPPLLDVPVYSLATLNEDGTTNMNILTYATPVSVTPHRVWSLSLFKGTQSDDNVRRTGTCVLQLLTRRHTRAVAVLGGTSGRTVDKRTACKELGLTWESLGDDDDDTNKKDNGFQVLPGCASYIKLNVKGGVVDAGSHHIAAFCEVTEMYVSKGNDDGSSDEDENNDDKGHLSSGYLRDVGIITEQGRVAESYFPVLQ